MRGRDPEGYYTALGVSQDASAAEIRLAYQFIKQSYHDGQKRHDIGKIRAAYQVLGDPKERRRYDRGGVTRTGPSGDQLLRQLKAHALPVAMVLLALALGALLFLVGPDLRAQFVGFDSGDELYWSESQKDIGKVEAYVKEHTFPTGTVAPAYRVRPADGSESVWYPARDLKRYARTH